MPVFSSKVDRRAPERARFARRMMQDYKLARKGEEG